MTFCSWDILSQRLDPTLWSVMSLKTDVFHEYTKLEAFLCADEIFLVISSWIWTHGLWIKCTSYRDILMCWLRDIANLIGGIWVAHWSYDMRIETRWIKTYPKEPIILAQIYKTIEPWCDCVFIQFCNGTLWFHAVKFTLEFTPNSNGYPSERFLLRLSPRLEMDFDRFYF